MSSELRDLLHEKMVELAEAWVGTQNKILLDVISLNGWSLDFDYIRDHITQQSLFDRQRYYHDNKLFLELETKWDSSDPTKIGFSVIPTLY